MTAPEGGDSVTRRSVVPDAIPLGMEVEFYADNLGLPLVPWQRMLLLRWFPEVDR